MPDEAQPGRAISSGSGPIVLREHAADDVFVDIDTKGPRNLLGDAATADAGIAGLEFNDRVDQLLRWAFWARAPMTTRREKPPIFASLERLVEFQQGSGLQVTASFESRLAGTNSDPRPKTKRSKESRFGARRRPRLLMTN